MGETGKQENVRGKSFFFFFGTVSTWGREIGREGGTGERRDSVSKKYITGKC